MRAAALDPTGRFEVVDLDDPTPGPNDLVLRTTGCGICGSDLKTRPMLPPTTVMGHEFCGEVVAVGTEAAATWKLGATAAALPLFTCGRCEHCTAGFVAHCTQVAMVGLGGAPGGFAELVRVDATMSKPIPPSVPAEWGALVEPFAVGLHAVRMADLQPRDRVLVIGGGPVGLTVAAWARQLGAGEVTVSDPADRRRDAAASFGASAVVDPTSEGLGGPYDVVFECVGRPGLLDASTMAVDARGRIVVVGVCTEPEPFLPVIPLMKETTMRFAVYYRPDEFETVIAAFADGSIDPAPLITRTAGLADLDDAFAGLATSPDDLKILIDPTA